MAGSARAKKASARSRFAWREKWAPWRARLTHWALSPYRFFRWLALLTGTLVWLGIFILSLIVYLWLASLPDIQTLSYTDIQNQAQKRIEKKLTEKKIKHRWVGIEQIHRDLLYAIVMAEDGNFFAHQGVDYNALLGAIAENIKRQEAAFGASTISQQVVKNIFLSEAKTLPRKFKEAVATRRLEKHLSKNQILELYLNVAEFGPNLFGVQAAAKYYFNKQPKHINAAEGAFLALMLPSPRKYHYTIYQNQHLSKQHRRKLKRILRDMAYREYISPARYERFLRYRYF